jgi:hypothetical protein
MAGVDIRTVQELLGHKGITMTVRYSHLAPKHIQVAMLDDSKEQQPDTTTDTGTALPVVIEDSVLQQTLQ